MFIMFHSSLIKDMTWITQDSIEFSMRITANTKICESRINAQLHVMGITVIRYTVMGYTSIHTCDVCMDVQNLRTSFRLNSEWIIPLIVKIEKPICLFLNRIPILVKDASNITER